MKLLMVCKLHERFLCINRKQPSNMFLHKNLHKNLLQKTYFERSKNPVWLGKKYAQNRQINIGFGTRGDLSQSCLDPKEQVAVTTEV